MAGVAPPLLIPVVAPPQSSGMPALADQLRRPVEQVLLAAAVETLRRADGPFALDLELERDQRGADRLRVTLDQPCATRFGAHYYYGLTTSMEGELVWNGDRPELRLVSVSLG